MQGGRCQLGLEYKQRRPCLSRWTTKKLEMNMAKAIPVDKIKKHTTTLASLSPDRSPLLPDRPPQGQRVLFPYLNSATIATNCYSTTAAQLAALLCVFMPSSLPQRRLSHDQELSQESHHQCKLKCMHSKVGICSCYSRYV